MVGPDRSNAGVRSHTHISGTEAIIDINRSRTGSPRALNIGATAAACSASIGRTASGAQHATAWRSTTGRDCFDMRLA